MNALEMKVVKWVRQGANLRLEDAIALVNETLVGFDSEGEPSFSGPRAEEVQEAYEAGVEWLKKNTRK